MLRYTRKEMKQAAKNDLRGKWGVSIGSFLLATYVPTNVAMLPYIFLYMGGLFSVMAESYVLGAVEILLSLVLLLMPLFLICGPLYMGYYLFNLRIARNEEVAFSTPYRCFTSGVYGRLTKGYFMYNLFILLWSMLLVIPGIIKSFSYAMMPYLMMDHPEMSWREALNESKRMMHGHKMDLFVLTISFFWWYVFAYFTSGLSMIYSGPYMYQAIANFYRDLKGEPLNVVNGISYEMPQ